MRYALTLLWALGTGACGTALNYVETGDPPRALSSRDARSVDVFMTSEPNRPFVEIGMIESQQESMSFDSEQTVVAKMRKFAGERGCDALVIFSGNDATVTSGNKDYTSSHTLKGYRGSCLVYTGPSAQPLAAALAASSCMPNATQLCWGPGGCRGAQRCTEDGKSYTVCDCGSDAPAQPAAAAATQRAAP